MSFVRQPQVNQRQHHEDERLQEHDQDMENRPDGTGNHMAEEQESATKGEGCISTQHRNHQEQQFTGIHVAPQPHAQGNHLGDIFNTVQDEIGRRKSDTERCAQQFMKETFETFDLHAEIKHQQYNA